MKKILGFVFLLICSFSFFSCDDFWESVQSVNQDESCTSEERVNTKLTYKSFSQLVKPIVFDIPVYDAGYNVVGCIMAIWDCDKDEMYDWVYTPKTKAIWNEMALLVEPVAGKKVFLIGGSGYTNYVVMDPEKTQLTDFPKKKGGNLNRTVNLLPYNMRPKFLAPVSSAHFLESEPHSLYSFSVMDINNGNEKPSVGFRQDLMPNNYRIDASTGKYVFMTAEDNVYILNEFDPVTNTLSQPGLKINMNIFDSSYDINECPNPEDPALHPDFVLPSLYTMEVLYADNDYTLISVNYSVYNDVTGETTTSRKIAVVQDRSVNNPQFNDWVWDIDFLQNKELYDCKIGFKINGHYYLVFEKAVTENDMLYFRYEIIEFKPAGATAEAKFVDANIELETGLWLDYFIRDNRLYYAWESDVGYGINFNYYDFATNTKGEVHCLDGTIFNQ